MYVSVIRGDLSKPLFVADVESKSQANPSTETPLGQTRYISRPDPVAVQAYLTAQSLSGTAAALITACAPVGGPVDLREATVEGVVGSTTDAQLTAIRALLAYKFVETTVVKESFLKGNLAGFRSASFNPDPRREPALTNGAAIAVVQDDGYTAFTVSVPTITTAVLSAGVLTITGTGLGATGTYETSAILLGTAGKTLTTSAIVAAGGSVSDTSIVIPATLTLGMVVGYTMARVRTNNQLSNQVALT